MTVEFWMLVWKVVLIGSVGVFATLAIVVTIGGAIDIGRLLKTLRQEHARSTAEATAAEDAAGPPHSESAG